MVLSTQDAQRTSRKDNALTFCVLEPVAVIEKNAVLIGLARHDSQSASAWVSHLLCYNALQNLQ